MAALASSDYVASCAEEIDAAIVTVEVTPDPALAPYPAVTTLHTNVDDTPVRLDAGARL